MESVELCAHKHMQKQKNRIKKEAAVLFNYACVMHVCVWVAVAVIFGPQRT